MTSAIGGRFGLSRVLDTRPSPQNTGAFWSAVTKTGLEGLKGAAPLVLHYEELCDEPRREVERLGRFLTESAPINWLDRAEHFRESPRNE